MKKVLVIEDETQSRDMFLEFLETEGFDAVGAENGFMGIQRAQECLPELVLCDILMPESDGYSVLTTLRQNPTTAIIPFIFLTAKAAKAEFRQGMELGADDYLTKPCTVEELLGAITARLERQTALRQWCTTGCQRVSGLPSVDINESAAPSSIFPCCPQLSEVFDYIETNYHQPIGLRDVAQEIGYSSAYLTSLVKRQTGQTVNRWIVERHMAQARSLLLETKQSVDEIAYAVGYQNAGHFFRQFRQYHDSTPQAWKKVQRNSYIDL